MANLKSSIAYLVLKKTKKHKPMSSFTHVEYCQGFCGGSYDQIFAYQINFVKVTERNERNPFAHGIKTNVNQLKRPVTTEWQSFSY
jgi:hypothetical protein